MTLTPLSRVANIPWRHGEGREPDLFELCPGREEEWRGVGRAVRASRSSLDNNALAVGLGELANGCEFPAAQLWLGEWSVQVWGLKGIAEDSGGRQMLPQRGSLPLPT